MSSLGVAPWSLALFAAIAFALYSVVIERGMALADFDAAQSPALTAALFATMITFVAFWLMTFARGVPMEAMTLRGVAPFVIAGIVYPALFRFLYFEGIDRIGAALASAILSAFPAVSAILAVWSLDERLGTYAAIGIALIVIGVALLQLTQQTEDAEQVTDILLERLAAADPVDFLFPATAMVTTGAAYVLIRYGLSYFPDPIAATAVTQTPAFVIFGAWAITTGAAGSSLNPGKAAVVAFIIAGGFNVMGWLGQFFALQSGTVITVVPLLNTIPLFIMAISYAEARQLPRSPRVITAVVAIVVGATLVQAFG